jgi:hypothetical protein
MTLKTGQLDTYPVPKTHPRIFGNGVQSPANTFKVITLSLESIEVIVKKKGREFQFQNPIFPSNRAPLTFAYKGFNRE